MTDLDELERKARAARNARALYSGGNITYKRMCETRLEFELAVKSPDTILSLIAEVREARKLLGRHSPNCTCAECLPF